MREAVIVFRTRTKLQAIARLLARENISHKVENAPSFKNSPCSLGLVVAEEYLPLVTHFAANNAVQVVAVFFKEEKNGRVIYKRV